MHAVNYLNKKLNYNNISRNKGEWRKCKKNKAIRKRDKKKVSKINNSFVSCNFWDETYSDVLYIHV